jgi:hypothetical protein
MSEPPTSEPPTAAPLLAPEPSGAPGDHRVPARRRRLFDGPLFWIGLIVFGLVLAAVLSFVPARGDTADNQPDEEAFCAQVDILGSTDLISLVAGIAGGAMGTLPSAPMTPTTIGPSGEVVPVDPVVPVAPLDPGGLGDPDPGASSTTIPSFGSQEAELDELREFDQQLMALERVAPHEVRTDVHEVRLAVDEVLAALERSTSAGPIPPTSLLFAVSDAQRDMQDAISRMASFVQDTCGIDVRNPILQPSPFGR